MNLTFILLNKVMLNFIMKIKK